MNELDGIRDGYEARRRALGLTAQKVYSDNAGPARWVALLIACGLALFSLGVLVGRWM